MWGARYFGLRDRLAGVMAGVDALARETGTGPGLAARVDPASGPWAPLRVMFCGEVNSGKSSLINAWLGCSLCPAGPLPTTQCVTWYRHGLQRADVETDGGVRECRRPLDFLKNVEVIDTPGINVLDRAGRVVLAARANQADMVVVVFGHANPWEPGTWELVERLAAGVLDRVLLVVQQSDRFEDSEVPVVLGHVRELSHKRAGRELPVLAVSAAQGVAACRTQPVDQRLWQASGLAGLGEYFAQRVCGSPRRCAGLREWHAAVAAELRAVDDRIDGQSRAVEGEAQFLTWMEGLVDGDRERSTTALAGRLGGYDEVARSMRRWLRRRLGVLASFVHLIVGDRTSGELDRVVVARVAAAARGQAQDDAVRLVAACRERWELLVPEVAERLGMVMRPFPEIEPALAEKAGRYVERFSEAAVNAAEDIRVGGLLGGELRRRLGNLGGWFSLSLMFATAAGVLGSLRQPQWPWVLLGCAGLVWIIAVIAAWVSRRRLTRELEDLLVAAESPLIERLRRDPVDGIRSFFADFARQLDPVRRRVARTRFALKPTLERASGLFAELKAVEQEIRRLDE